MGGWEIFKVSLHSWERVANSLILWRPPVLLMPPFFFKFFRHSPLTPIPCHLQSHPPLLFLLSCFFGWMDDHATFDVLFYLIIIWSINVKPCYFSTRRTLMSVLCSKASTLLRPDIFCGFLVVLWFDITKTNTPQKQTTHSGASRLTHP